MQKKMSFRAYALSLAGALALAACQSGQKIVQVPKPSFLLEHYQSSTIDTNPRINLVQFKLLSEKPSKRKAEEWMAEEGLSLPAKVFHDGATTKALRKMQLSQEFEKDLRSYQASKDKTYYLAHIVEQDNELLIFYGNAPNEFHTITDVSLLRVYNKRDKAFTLTLDFNNFGYPPDFIHREKDFIFEDLLWARKENSILYVQNAHWTYAESSKKCTGYLTALDLSAKNKILWRSQPMVGNAVNFLDFDRFIVSAYGFTREDGYLYALDKQTGKVVGSIQLFKSSSSAQKHISFIIAKGRTIYVKLGDGTEYQVQVN
jgi:hypothetical protein